jgi:hypothetical protein
MNPIPFSNKTQTSLTRENDPLATGCSAETKRALQLISGEMQKYFMALTNLVETLPSEPERAGCLKSALEEQLTHLNEKLSLMGTILETDSSEILRYVRKCRP